MIININMEKKVIMKSLILTMIKYKERRIKVKHQKISKKKQKLIWMKLKMMMIKSVFQIITILMSKKVRQMMIK